MLSVGNEQLGRPADGLSLLLGGVLIDAQISELAVDAGIIGRRPVGVPALRAIASVDYANVGLKGLSFDAGVRMDWLGTARSWGLSHFQPGTRYRFRVAGQDLVARAQIQNVLGSYSWEVNSSETLTYSAPGRFRLLLTGNF